MSQRLLCSRKVLQASLIAYSCEVCSLHKSSATGVARPLEVSPKGIEIAAKVIRELGVVEKKLRVGLRSQSST